ncbi:hypothetical protein CLOM_g21135 [Closterium sp. NIES-68]|nr:hypothetical protein CLOM_g21135 [Closterium sp. NIES-68]GJP75228.1 hypothetical protein CLOP_g5687 [Closterium sp. NIES-67]
MSAHSCSLLRLRPNSTAARAAISAPRCARFPSPLPLLSPAKPPSAICGSTSRFRRSAASAGIARSAEITRNSGIPRRSSHISGRDGGLRGIGVGSAPWTNSSSSSSNSFRIFVLPRVSPPPRRNAQRELVPPVVCRPNASLSSGTGERAEPIAGGEVVGGKYRIVRLLGEGSSGRLYEAEEVGEGGPAEGEVGEGGGGERVAVKCISLRSATRWKYLDLFEREARVLRSLNHPGIPQYIDYFEEDTATDKAFYLVQRLAQGQSLAALVAGGWRGNEEEVVRIGVKVLEVLSYLESVRPPVVHRDIKPDNIILDQSRGTVQVVDFGAVQEAAASARSDAPLGSTVVGTYGYMAPEQFQNRATSQSDLYSLGATLLFLLSGRPPSAFPQNRLKIDFQSSLGPSVSPRLATVLDCLLMPAPEDRFKTARDVINALTCAESSLYRYLPNHYKQQQQQQQQPNSSSPTTLSTAGMGGSRFNKAKGASSLMQRPPSSVAPLQNLPASFLPPSAPLTRPAGTQVVLERTEGGKVLVVHIPPAGLTREAVGTGGFAIAWNAFIAFWTASALTGGAPLLFTAFSIPFWLVGGDLAKKVVSSIAVSVDLVFDRRGEGPGGDFSITWRVGDLWSHTERGRCADVSRAAVVVEGFQNGEPMAVCQLAEGVKEHRFGGGLKPVEQQWVVGQIGEFLGIGFGGVLGVDEEASRRGGRNQWSDDEEW